MKRVGNLYSRICDIDNIRLAHHNARKGKSFYTEVKAIDADEDKYLYSLQDMLVHHAFKTSQYEKFQKVDGGKVRGIYKLPYFPDRVCQWALIQIIEPYLIRTMTADTYSAIPGRGTELARRKLVQALRTDPDNTRWCLKTDIHKYYPSLNISILKQTYARIFKDDELLWLLYEILDSSPDAGVPIGNYVSQYSGNIYLSPFDHRVKEKWKVKHYFRYMDDMIFTARTKSELQRLLETAQSWLAEELLLELKPNWSLFRVEDRGIDFVGYVFKHNSTRLRKTIADSVRSTGSEIRHRVNSDVPLTRRLYFAFNSLSGWCDHSDSKWLRIKNFDIVEDYVKEYHDKYLANKEAENYDCI